MDKEFLELTEKNGRFKVLVRISSIISIFRMEKGNAFVETGVDENGDSVGFETMETYKELAHLLFFGLNKRKV